MADARLVVGVVGTPERAELAEKVGTLIGHLGQTKPVDRVPAGVRADRSQLVADFVDGLLPLDAVPLAVREFHRIFQTPVAHDQFAHGGTLGAVRTAVDRRIPTRLLADPNSVRHFGGDRAADRAVRANALADGDGGARGGRRTGLRLAHAGEWQCAERGETARGETGPAQEAAAVGPVFALGGDGREGT